VIGPTGTEIEIRLARAAREVLTSKKGRASPSYGIRLGSAWPSRDGSHDRMNTTGAGGCENRVCYCPSLRCVSPTKKERANVAGRGREGGREREGERRSFDPSTREAKTESKLCVREMRPLTVWLEMTRSADAPGTRKVGFPGRRLHEASPTVPGSPGSEPLCPGCGVLPEAILRFPGQEECPFCP
jgi:hypothetical protein